MVSESAFFVLSDHIFEVYKDRRDGAPGSGNQQSIHGFLPDTTNFAHFSPLKPLPMATSYGPDKSQRSSYGDRQSTVRFGRSKASEVLGELSVKEVQVGGFGLREGQPT